MFALANRMNTIQASPTLVLNSKAAQLRAQGIDVINFSTGEPDFETPKWIQEAAIQAMQQGLTKYTPTDGIPILKEAVQKKMRRDYILDYDLDELTIGAGAKQLIFNAFLASIDPGDEVIIPAPYWVSYPDIVNFCGGVSIIVSCHLENNFKITPNQLRDSITKRTKWIILNSPNNPTGSVYSKEELLALSKVLMEESHVNILSDDIYELLTYDDACFSSIVCVEPRLRFRTLIINGVSKSYAMTGWRLGFAAGPSSLIKAMNMLHSQSTSNVCSVTQGAATAAFNGPQNFIIDWMRIYEEHRNVSHQMINNIPGLHCLLPKGAFYHYINCEEILGKTTPDGKYLRSDKDVGLYFLEKAQVVVVSGDSFGLSPYFRISYTGKIENIKEGCKRIADAVAQLN